ncbi:MAG TPA: serine protease, partial [Planctomycetota bacterium]|nr:serine protease [Planctomycetota bacterium]
MGSRTWRLLVVGALGACGGALPAPEADRRSSLDRVPPAVRAAYGRRRAGLTPALVSLRSIVGRKSGAIIEPGGLILTCLHGSTAELTEAVTFSDGSVGTARLRAAAPDLDVALLEILRPTGPFPSLGFARSADAGEWTFLARPFSSGEEDAAGRPAVVGVPLAYGPDLYVHSGLLVGLPAFPGDSGAPLLNAQCEIVGVALGAARRSGTGTLSGASAAGILDALPSLRQGRSLAPLPGAMQVEAFLR